jgi:hypothetical protein
LELIDYQICSKNLLGSGCRAGDNRDFGSGSAKLDETFEFDHYGQARPGLASECLLDELAEQRLVALLP